MNHPLEHWGEVSGEPRAGRGQQVQVVVVVVGLAQLLLVAQRHLGPA